MSTGMISYDFLNELKREERDSFCQLISLALFADEVKVYSRSHIQSRALSQYLNISDLVNAKKSTSPSPKFKKDVESDISRAAKTTRK